MKAHIKFSAIMAVLLGTSGLLLVLLTAHAAPPTPTCLPPAPAPSPVKAAQNVAPATTVSPDATPSADNSGVLDNSRQFALSMIETGINDNEIGGAGEISRYQIMPAVWQHYTSSHRYCDPEVSLEVARQHWTALYESFKQRAHREPTDFDMYVLWNTRYGYYAKRGFQPGRLQAVVRDRAQRFVNLVELGATQYATR